MVNAMPSTWTVRGATFALWLLAAACAAFWALRLGSGPEVAAPPAPGPRTVAVDPAAVGRLLGGVPTAPGVVIAAPVATLASRFQLIGVAAGASSGGGAAVIAVDGKTAKPYRVGSVVEEGLVLQSVQGRRAVLAQGGTPAVTLELPAFKK
ncbi:MAG TPA: type II secretion system protein N [Ramlibacter sp.]|jgi:general secretion pathway protein C